MKFRADLVADAVRDTERIAPARWSKEVAAREVACAMARDQVIDPSQVDALVRVVLDVIEATRLRDLQRNVGKGDSVHARLMRQRQRRTRA